MKLLNQVLCLLRCSFHYESGPLTRVPFQNVKEDFESLLGVGGMDEQVVLRFRGELRQNCGCQPSLDSYHFCSPNPNHTLDVSLILVAFTLPSRVQLSVTLST